MTQEVNIAHNIIVCYELDTQCSAVFENITLEASAYCEYYSETINDDDFEDDEDTTQDFRPLSHKKVTLPVGRASRVNKQIRRNAQYLYIREWNNFRGKHQMPTS